MRKLAVTHGNRRISRLPTVVAVSVNDAIRVVALSACPLGSGLYSTEGTETGVEAVGIPRRASIPKRLMGSLLTL